MRLVVENLKSDAIQHVLDGMVEEADKAVAKYDAAEQPQAGGTVKKSYYKVISLLANEAAKQGLIGDSLMMKRRIVSSADPARQEPATPPLPDDAFEAALVKEISARAVAPSSCGEITFDQEEIDEIERQLQMELTIKKHREAYAKFSEEAALAMLEKLKGITKPGDFFRLLPTVHKVPDPPNCFSAYAPENTVIVLPSTTFQYQGKTVTRNCAVNKRTVKVGHPLGFKMPDGSHLIRSVKNEPGKDERWVKVVKYQSGMLIRYFTHIEDQDAPNLRWHGVVRGGEIVPISETEYRGLEAQLKD